MKLQTLWNSLRKYLLLEIICSFFRKSEKVLKFDCDHFQNQSFLYFWRKNSNKIEKNRQLPKIMKVKTIIYRLWRGGGLEIRSSYILSIVLNFKSKALFLIVRKGWLKIRITMTQKLTVVKNYPYLLRVKKFSIFNIFISILFCNSKYQEIKLKFENVIWLYFWPIDIIINLLLVQGEISELYFYANKINNSMSEKWRYLEGSGMREFNALGDIYFSFLGHIYEKNFQ